MAVCVSLVCGAGSVEDGHCQLKDLAIDHHRPGVTHWGPSRLYVTCFTLTHPQTLPHTALSQRPMGTLWLSLLIIYNQI